MTKNYVLYTKEDAYKEFMYQMVSDGFVENNYTNGIKINDKVGCAISSHTKGEYVTLYKEFGNFSLENQDNEEWSSNGFLADCKHEDVKEVGDYVESKWNALKKELEDEIQKRWNLYHYEWELSESFIEDRLEQDFESLIRKAYDKL